MEINNSNLTANIANSISKLKLTSAQKAFSAQKENKEEEIAQAPVIEEVEKPVSESAMQATFRNRKIDIEDIQKYANYMGENLSIDDINYGLMYGRSVIADYSI